MKFQEFKEMKKCFIEFYALSVICIYKSFMCIFDR